MKSVRVAYFFGLVIVMCLIGFSYYLQNNGFVPCPLCILQRVTMITLGVLFLIGAARTFKKPGNVILCLLGWLITLSGMILAGRQSWLQYAPPQESGGCGVSLHYLLSILPITDVAKMVWQGGTECSELGWVFLGLSLAEWSLITFGCFFIFVTLQLKRTFK